MWYSTLRIARVPFRQAFFLRAMLKPLATYEKKIRHFVISHCPNETTALLSARERSQELTSIAYHSASFLGISHRTPEKTVGDTS